MDGCYLHTPRPHVRVHIGDSPLTTHPIYTTQEYLTDIGLDRYYFLCGPGARTGTADDEATALTLLDGEEDDEEEEGGVDLDGEVQVGGACVAGVFALCV